MSSSAASMLVCRPRPHRLAALSRFGTSSARSTSTSPNSATTSTSQPADKPADSIFTAPESPWDHVFSDIEPSPSAQRLRTRLNDNNNVATSPSGRKKGHAPNSNQSLVQRSSAVRQQRASITAREMSVFDEMFDLIFNAVSARDGKASPSSPGSTSSASARMPSSAALPSSAPSVSGQTPSIGRAGTPLNDLFRTLRRQTSRVRWTTAIDEELDRKKETMELFNTDHDLLQWVTKEVFGESQKWDEEAKKAMATSRAGATTEEGKGKDRSVAATSGSPKERPGNHSIYPHLIAHAMRIFRTTYFNPSLSLAIFNHAARVSIPSYVFGCTAPAYNELIEAKWEGWGDLEGVCNALEEMRANGVKIDGRTRIVAEKVRRDVGEARPVESPSVSSLGSPEDGHAGLNDAKDVNPLARRVWEELGEAEVMRLLHRIERLALRDRSRKSTSTPHDESWKSAVLQPAEDDGWSFDGWDEKKIGDTKRQRRKAKPASQDGVHSRTLDDWTVLGTPEEETAFR